MGRGIEAAPGRRIGIVDNDAMTRAFLRQVIERNVPGYRVIWCAAQGEQAIGRCGRGDDCPDLLIMDMSLEGIGGVQACAVIRSRNATMPILAITSFEPGTYLAAAAEAGAQCLVGKSDLTAIEQAVELVANGGVMAPVGSVRFDAPAAAYGRLSSGNGPHYGPLSFQEATVMDLCIGGYTSEQIAGLLGIASATVRTHVAHAKKKLDASNLSQAAVRWMQIKTV
ncbi:response regulator transcription factor [Bifidobacterium biavatii]|uniref:Two component transcriptional regulator, LuxR family n=1 Tax=Bifidobacterium biavatii DSM 23969 TaxID=1437608 RepID=A0A086ZUI7_9BIFI|nr:response regulator transcription factor [Bifidobacterium biavatii]KFI50187.1 two component transcriptional regulator, LuxR family [Bifidobacterium biavatii DSM 23969]